VKAIAVVVLCASFGCKDPTQPAPPANPSGSGSQAAGGSAVPRGKGPTIVLPLPRGQTLPKSKAKLDKATADKLAALTFEGFGADIRRQNEQGVEVKHKTDARPKLMVTVTVTPCFDCIPMEIEKWKAKGEALRALLAPEIRTRPETKFEVGDTTLLGQKMIYTYQLAFYNGPDETGQPVYVYSDAYILYYNDGINHIRVIAEYKDDPVKDVTALADLAPKDILERMAKAFMVAYVQAWASNGAG